jgi:hypothetical protein
MARFLAYRIVSGNLKFNEVPVPLKEKVREVLIEMNRDDLIIVESEE